MVRVINTSSLNCGGGWREYNDYETDGIVWSDPEEKEYAPLPIRKKKTKPVKLQLGVSLSSKDS